MAWRINTRGGKGLCKQKHKTYTDYLVYKFNHKYKNKFVVDQLTKSTFLFVCKNLARSSKVRYHWRKGAAKKQHEQMQNPANLKYRSEMIDQITHLLLCTKKLAWYRCLCSTREKMISVISSIVSVLNIRNFILACLLAFCSRFCYNIFTPKQGQGWPTRTLLCKITSILPCVIPLACR